MGMAFGGGMTGPGQGNLRQGGHIAGDMAKYFNRAGEPMLTGLLMKLAGETGLSPYSVMGNNAKWVDPQRHQTDTTPNFGVRPAEFNQPSQVPSSPFQPQQPALSSGFGQPNQNMPAPFRQTSPGEFPDQQRTPPSLFPTTPNSPLSATNFAQYANSGPPGPRGPTPNYNDASQVIGQNNPAVQSGDNQLVSGGGRRKDAPPPPSIWSQGQQALWQKDYDLINQHYNDASNKGYSNMAGRIGPQGGSIQAGLESSLAGQRGSEVSRAANDVTMQGVQQSNIHEQMLLQALSAMLGLPASAVQGLNQSGQGENNFRSPWIDLFSAAAQGSKW